MLASETSVAYSCGWVNPNRIQQPEFVLTQIFSMRFQPIQIREDVAEMVSCLILLKSPGVYVFATKITILLNLGE